MPHYFFKELVATPLYLPEGVKVKFDDIGDASGIFRTDDPKVGEEILKHVGRGGVSELTQDQYEELLKKKPGLRSPGVSERDPSLVFDQRPQPGPVGPGPRVSLSQLALSPFAMRPGGVDAVQAPITERSDTEGTPAPLHVPTKAEFRKPKLAKP